jgi:hypothetical protein
MTDEISDLALFAGTRRAPANGVNNSHFETDGGFGAPAEFAKPAIGDHDHRYIYREWLKWCGFGRVHGVAQTCLLRKIQDLRNTPVWRHIINDFILIEIILN